MVRNIVGAIFPLFSDQMYVKLGNEWATTLLAFLSLLLVPIPFFLFYKGRVVRYKVSHFDVLSPREGHSMLISCLFLLIIVSLLPRAFRR